MRRPLALLLIAAGVMGCRTEKAKQEAAPVVVAPETRPGPPSTTEMPKDAVHAGIVVPKETPKPAAPEAKPHGEAAGLTGKVLERIEAAPYCYLRLKTAKGEVWAAVPDAKVQKGAEVTVVSPMLMTQFESKTLKRTFAEVYFGTLASSAGAASANPHGQVAPVASTVEVGKIDKASGPESRTVGEVWGEKDALKGKTVVIAFFPKARTPGCTTQMTAYRDRYAQLFHGGKDVVLLGVSTDSDAALIDWAKEAGFPFAFVSDADGTLGEAYGALSPGGLKFASRLLFVVGPDGRVAYTATPFRQNTEEAYTELGAAIDRAAAM